MRSLVGEGGVDCTGVVGVRGEAKLHGHALVVIDLSHCVIVLTWLTDSFCFTIDLIPPLRFWISEHWKWRLGCWCACSLRFRLDSPSKPTPVAQLSDGDRTLIIRNYDLHST